MKVKSLKTSLSIIAIAFIVLLAGLLFASCGNTDPHSTYVFETDAPEQVEVNEQINFNVTLKAKDIREEGYEKVLIRLELDKEDGMEIIASDGEGHEYNLTDLKTWGGSGFELTKDYEVSTPIQFRATKAGTFSLTLKLVDLNNDEEVITEQTATITVVEAQA